MTMRTQTMPDWAVAAQLAEGPTYGGTRRGTGRIAIRPTPRRRTFQDFVPDYAQAAGVSRLPSRAAAVAPRPAIQNTVPDYVQAARMAATRAAVPVEEAPFAPIRPTMPPVPGPIDQGLIPPERGEDVMPDVMPRLPMSPYPFPLEPLPMPPYAGPFPNWPNQLMPYPPFAPPQGEIPRGAPPQWEIPIPIWPRGAPPPREIPIPIWPRGAPPPRPQLLPYPNNAPPARPVPLGRASPYDRYRQVPLGRANPWAMY